MSLLPLNSEPTEKLIFNPDTEDFSVDYNDDNGIKTYTIPAISLKSFPLNIANHIKKHLATMLYFKRGNKVNYEADIEEIYKEIESE